MKITAVSSLKVRGMWNGPYFPRGNRQVQALDVYPEFNTESWAKGPSETLQSIQEIYLTIQTDEGITGMFGPIEDTQAFVIQPMPNARKRLLYLCF